MAAYTNTYGGAAKDSSTAIITGAALDTEFDAIAAHTAHSKVEATGDTTAGDNSAMGYTSTEGCIITGQGSVNDVTIKNDVDADVIKIPTGTTNVDIVGEVTGTGFTGTLDGVLGGGTPAAVTATSVTVNSGNVVLSSGNGIDFSATGDGSGTATSELLDDYEEGTWTPSVVGGVTGADCSYVKVGRMVTIGGTISGMVLSGAGGVLIAGLPYAPATSSKHCCPILAQNLGKTGYESFTGWLDSDGTEISFWGQNLGVQDGATWAQLVHNDLGVSHKIIFTMSYFAAT